MHRAQGFVLQLPPLHARQSSSAELHSSMSPKHLLLQRGHRLLLDNRRFACLSVLSIVHPGALAALWGTDVLRLNSDPALLKRSFPQEDERTALSVDLERAFDGFVPSSLRGIQMTKSDTRFAEVGGLAFAKRSIRDILELPVKFAPLYENAPIRLPTGILLYVAVESSIRGHPLCFCTPLPLLEGFN